MRSKFSGVGVPDCQVATYRKFGAPELTAFAKAGTSMLCTLATQFGRLTKVVEFNVSS
jgi:hypothetical protein